MLDFMLDAMEPSSEAGCLTALEWAAEVHHTAARDRAIVRDPASGRLVAIEVDCMLDRLGDSGGGPPPRARVTLLAEPGEISDAPATPSETPAAGWDAIGDVAPTTALVANASCSYPALAAPAQRTRFVATDGSDAAPGTRERPWRTLGYAVDQLRPGDTLLVRGGIYRESGIEIRAHGRPDAPITIAGHPGERAVLDGSFAEFQTPGNDAWVEVDPEIRLFRSRRTYEAAKRLYGKLEIGAALYALNIYDRMEALTSPSHDYRQDGDYYLGPGLHWSPDDGHLYIRLDAPDPGSLHGRDLAPSDDPDPRRHALHIGQRSSGLSFADAHHVVVRGLEVRHFYRTIDVESGGAIAVLDTRLVPGKTGVLLDSGVDHVALRGVTVDAGFPPWVSWLDVKQKPRPASSLKLTGVLLRDSDCIVIAQSRFHGVFDGVTATWSPVGLRVLNNRFDHVVDDALQLGTGASHVEFAYNLVYGPGPSHHGSGPSAAPGTKYIHHNVIHIRDEELYGRRGQHEIGWRHHIPFPAHSMADAGADPWKLYANTVIFWPNSNRRGAGQNRRGPRGGPPHEVYNNVFLQLGDDRVASEERVDDGAEIFDGNLYHRGVTDPAGPLFRSWSDGREERSFDSLVEFRNSDFARSTMRYYPPGWEYHGVEGDPALRDPEGGDYRPAIGGPADGGALDLSATGWPGADGAGHRGAVDPHATTGLGIVGPSPRSRSIRDERRQTPDRPPT